MRAQSAEETRARILDAALALFGDKGVDRVTVAAIGDRAQVAASTVYAVFKSKAGILRALMERALFGSRFRSAQDILAGVTDPVALIGLTAEVARAIYESEDRDLGLLRNISGFSPLLREVEQEFEALRYEMQEARVRALFAAGKAKAGLSLDEARRILWMYTSRDVYRMLVCEGGWPVERYRGWLSQTLVDALVAR
ncbi:TetR/AcrR family transcriptional regulator [Bosea sp. CS1GBMeth4]|uniref:TetR/AcrR family transcriptional regulator n=1 Tax=Bosea sp. CS1GBMeth4 TaxID=1892849 RepID=UPI001FCE3009|nr:TetR/AcrR family transcriptional regulator [Bosea sp. CS1GBMeth4]